MGTEAGSVERSFAFLGFEIRFCVRRGLPGRIRGKHVSPRDEGLAVGQRGGQFDEAEFGGEFLKGIRRRPRGLTAENSVSGA
jgi:hypothetical protein